MTGFNPAHDFRFRIINIFGPRKRVLPSLIRTDQTQGKEIRPMVHEFPFARSGPCTVVCP